MVLGCSIACFYIWHSQSTRFLAIIMAMIGMVSIVVVGAIIVAAEIGEGILNWLSYGAIAFAFFAGVTAFTMLARLPDERRHDERRDEAE